MLFYDLDKNQWYKQQTTFIDGDEPITRTRFCGQTVYSNTTNTWEYAITIYLSLEFSCAIYGSGFRITLLILFSHRLWIYGGQLVDDKGTGVDDIYVLSMPSFMYGNSGHLLKRPYGSN